MTTPCGAWADCTELMQSVAVTVALVVDPVLKRVEPAPAVLEVRPAPAAAPPAPEAPALQWGISVGASANIGLSTGIQPTLRLEGRVRAPLWSLGLEGRFAWPLTGALTQGALTTSAVLGAVVPCLHWKWLAGCVDFSAGALRLEGQALATALDALPLDQRALFVGHDIQHTPITELARELEVPPVAICLATRCAESSRPWCIASQNMVLRPSRLCSQVKPKSGSTCTELISASRSE